MIYNVQRTYIPGSEWVYVKIYCSSISADKILVNQLDKLTTYLKNEGKIEKWFFIRYSDPYFHIRLRLLLRNSADIAAALELILKKLNPLVKNGIVSKIQLDTYNRELERYGADLMVLSESFFHIDSIYTIDFLKAVQKSDKNEDFVWLSAMLFIDRFLAVFQFDIEHRLLLMKGLEAGFWSEFGIDGSKAKYLNSLYRGYKVRIREFLENGDSVARKPLKLNLEGRERELKPLVKRGLEATKTFDRLPIDSYIHMMMNRLFPSRNRYYELFVYSFLFNYYRSVSSRHRSNITKG